MDSLAGAREAGIDVGATFAKLAWVSSDGTPGFELMPAQPEREIAERLTGLSLERVGVTGCGGRSLADVLSVESVRVDEFSAWGAGASRLLAANGPSVHPPYLLVSLGTGTSVLRVDPQGTRRVGGTALGGGTLVGLASRLVQPASFREFCSLASQGSRSRVDLLISDIDPGGDIPLPREATAAAFGKLQRGLSTPSQAPERADLAAAITTLVGENVALLCNALASAEGLDAVVFGGTSLRGNPLLATVLQLVTAARGHQTRILHEGEFAGAVGALHLAASA